MGAQNLSFRLRIQPPIMIHCSLCAYHIRGSLSYSRGVNSRRSTINVGRRSISAVAVEKRRPLSGRLSNFLITFQLMSVVIQDASNTWHCCKRMEAVSFEIRTLEIANITTNWTVETFGHKRSVSHCSKKLTHFLWFFIYSDLLILKWLLFISCHRFQWTWKQDFERMAVVAFNLHGRT